MFKLPSKCNIKIPFKQSLTICRAERSRIETLKSEKHTIDAEFEKGLREEIESLAKAIEKCNLETDASSKVVE